MVGMFGGVKLRGGGKLVMGEVCSIRIIKSVAVSLKRLMSTNKFQNYNLPRA